MKKLLSHQVTILLFCLCLVSLFGAVVLVFLQKKSLREARQFSPSSSSLEKTTLTPPQFFKRSLNETCLEDLDLADIPNFKEIQGIVRFRDNIFLSGDGSILVYSTETNAVTAFSDPKIAQCNSNLALVGDYLYAPCRTLAGYPTETFPPYEIYKIHLPDMSVEYVYSTRDGLVNQQNYKVFPDGQYLWVSTFDGVARIDSSTDQVEFFRHEMGLGYIAYGIPFIYVDKKYVWVYVNANSKSKGGFGMFDKTSQKWQAFKPEDIKDDGVFDRFDLEYNSTGYIFKSVPGGVQFGYREKDHQGIHELLVEKQFQYSTGQFLKIGSRTRTGENFKPSEAYLSLAYPPLTEYDKQDDKGFIQLYFPDGRLASSINGRSFLDISSPVAGKRYLVTSSSLDYLDAEINFPEIVLEFGRSIDFSMPHEANPEIKIYTAPISRTLILFDSGYSVSMYDGSGLWGTMNLRAIDAETNNELAVFKSQQRFFWRAIPRLEVQEEEKEVFLVDPKTKKRVVGFNRQSLQFKVLDNSLSATE